MTTQTSPQYASIEQPFGCEPPLVHCPICGNKTSHENEINPCKHLAFVYVGELNEFIYQSEVFGNRFETTLTEHQEIDEDEYSCIRLDTLQDCLKEAGYDNNLLALEITYGGMACGPVWFTDVYGFDYGTLADSEA
jgi:hypothetical protein